jgi:ribosomal RNA-processing protein 1
MLFALKNSEWDEETLKQFAVALNKTVFQMNKCPKGLIFHICDIYVEEIAKVAQGDLTEDRTHLLIEPFLVFYAKQSDALILKHVEKNIIEQLLYQSELGQSYQEKFDIWKQANFPTRSIDDIEIRYQVRGNKSFGDDDLSDGQEEDIEERAMDPRAGRVNVELSEISFDALKFVEAIESLRYKPFTTSKSRKGLSRIANNFRKFGEGNFPIGIKSMPQEHAEDEADPIDIDLKAIELAEFEKKLALGDVDVDSESSDFDEDLDNRKHGKLKRKSKDAPAKIKDKKQKMSKLHNERFFKTAAEDFSQEEVNNAKEEEDDEDETPPPETQEMKIKKKKKAAKAKSDEESKPPKIKLQKRKKSSATNGFEESDNVEEKSTVEFKQSEEWSEPAKEGEYEFFVPSKKLKLKAAAAAVEQQNKPECDSPSTSSKSSSLVLNPFAKGTPGKKKSSDEQSSFSTPTPRISLHETPKSSGKRVIIALNKNKAQSENDYIKQVKQSPNLPTNNLSMKPTKSALKKNASLLPSPINPFYLKKIGGLKKDLNKTS